MAISNENKTIAKTALQAFGGKPTVAKYWDDDHNSSVDLLSTLNMPYDGITSYSTIGLSDYSIGYSVDEKPLMLEIVGANATEYDLFPNILGTCAFYVINSKVSIYPGKILQRIIKMYYSDSEMEHVLLTTPFLWDLKTLEFQNKTVTWLLAVPISEEEFLYAEQKGTEALEELFEKKDIDIFDINRRSIL